jgi:glutamine synthetase
MYLYPDPATFAVLPLGDGIKTARLICDIYRPNGNPFEGDPRHVLRKVLDEAKEMGFDFVVGPECEFFLFQRDRDGAPTTQAADEASYFDVAPMDTGEAARLDIVRTLGDMGFHIDGAHHENAPGQHEIDFRYSNALSAADNIITYKFVVKVVAQKYGFNATFMPKPIGDLSGSGMHCNMSLFRNEENAFYDIASMNELSHEAQFFIGGLLLHAKGMTAITNPLVNSYKRLVSGCEAPMHIVWSMGNRSPLIRIPETRGINTRIEMRNPDASCNPYLAFAVMLKAGLWGIKNKIAPPDPLDGNFFSMSRTELVENDIEKLPKNLDEAIGELLKDELIMEALGPHVLNSFVRAKRIEWEEYSNAVHTWEVERYLNAY